MTKLYLDCDGVILDTIKTSYQMIEKKGIHTEQDVGNFYKTLNWEMLIEESGQINNSINKIKELLKYFDIEILTHIYSENESITKKHYFEKELPGVKVTAVPKTIQKADYVDPTNSILVDDFTPNLDYWKEKGGIPVKFSVTNKNCVYPVISDLLELIKIFSKNKIEVKE